MKENNRVYKENAYKDNKFYIFGIFDKSLLENIIIPLTEEGERQIEKKDGILKIYINSRGGETKYVITLIELIESFKRKGVIVETYVMQNAFSCGSLLAISGTKGHRYISKYGIHLCHLGSVEGIKIYTDLQLERESGYVKYHFDTARALYKKYAKVPDIEEKMKDDSYFIYAKDCIKFKLADKYIK